MYMVTCPNALHRPKYTRMMQKSRTSFGLRAPNQHRGQELDYRGRNYQDAPGSQGRHMKVHSNR